MFCIIEGLSVICWKRDCMPGELIKPDPDIEGWPPVLPEPLPLVPVPVKVEKIREPVSNPTK